MSALARRRRRRSLGQHYLVDPAVVDEMIASAALRPSERVLEIGTGRGALTKKLVRVATRLEGYEVDRESYEELRSEMIGAAVAPAGPTSLVLRNEDAFKSSPDFDVLVSSLPYSESSNFVEWLAQRRRYRRAVVLVQRDFAMKLTAPPSSPIYRAVSVISQASATIRVVSNVKRSSFDPPPRVDTCMLEMTWKRTLDAEQIAAIKRIFSQKRRTVRAALKNLGLPQPESAPPDAVNLQLQCRVNSLRPESVLAMAGLLSRARKKIGEEEEETA